MKSKSDLMTANVAADFVGMKFKDFMEFFITDKIPFVRELGRYMFSKLELTEWMNNRS